MAEINVEMLKEKLYPVAKALFMMGETLVDESKMHISAEDAIKKIRSYMRDTNVICSRLLVDRLIAECMEPQIYNTFEKQQDEWLTKYWGKWIGLEPTKIDYPDCCDGCSNNPKNGGSGICNCTLPHMQYPTLYTTNASMDDCCMTATDNTGAYIFGKEKPNVDNMPKADANRIEQARDNISKYEKRV